MENKAHSRGFKIAILDGNVDDTWPPHLTFYYAVLHQDLTGNLCDVIEHDLGQQHNAECSSLVQYLTYDLNPEWSVGLRAEWFRDNNGPRFAVHPSSYYEISDAANWNTSSWLGIRPELRYDWAAGITPFDDGIRNNQLLLAIDTVLRF